MKTFIRKEELNKKSPVELLGEDVREGLTAIVSVKIPDPKYKTFPRSTLTAAYPVSLEPGSNANIFITFSLTREAYFRFGP